MLASCECEEGRSDCWSCTLRMFQESLSFPDTQRVSDLWKRGNGLEVPFMFCFCSKATAYEDAWSFASACVATLSSSGHSHQ